MSHERTYDIDDPVQMLVAGFLDDARVHVILKMSIRYLT
jgi:hypothetical protein